MLTESFRVFFYCGQNQVTIFIVSDHPAGLLSRRELRARLGGLLMIGWRATAHVFLPVLEEGPRAEK